MSLAGLIDAALDDPALATVLEAAGRSGARPLALSGPAALGPLAICTLAGPTGRTALGVPSTGREAEDLLASLQCLLPPDSVALYPGWETLPHERLSPRAGTISPRLARLRRLR